MADVLEPEQRHRNMAAIHSASTKPELLLRKSLWRLGFRYRINDNRLPGKPDIVLPKYHTVIFVHGCFWHAHEGCKYASRPSTNTDYWNAKFERNRNRDARVQSELEAAGWKVVVI
jgi:DNA mismatch endonuclease (patch repair protein)